jgi:Holliday junction resolvase-like predicted endonuclease
VESNDRFFRRRANEEMNAASRAVTEAARERRMRLANIFLERLKDAEQREATSASIVGSPHEHPAFEWRDSRSLERA